MDKEPFLTTQCECWINSEEENSLLRVSQKKKNPLPTILLGEREEKQRDGEKGEDEREQRRAAGFTASLLAVLLCDGYTACYPACCGGQRGRRLWVATSCPLAAEGLQKKKKKKGALINHPTPGHHRQRQLGDNQDHVQHRNAGGRPLTPEMKSLVWLKKPAELKLQPTNWFQWNFTDFEDEQRRDEGEESVLKRTRNTPVPEQKTGS